MKKKVIPKNDISDPSKLTNYYWHFEKKSASMKRIRVNLGQSFRLSIV